ncbi:MAG: phospholipid carrier-dependent glycosyltransferase [Acidobacteria bacterium]|nr:phospholipid carrier-dependent glycosyltransferase [Candidatus Sulfomarinibacter kjeldsenii]
MNSSRKDMSLYAPAGGFSKPALVIWLLMVVLTVGYGIGGYGLIEPDEGRNAEVAREMAATNNYVLPHLNGLPYLDKPVLFFAAVAASIEVFGVNEFAARLASLLLGLATAALTGWFALRFWGRDAAVVAATATATAPLALGLSRIVIMDTMLSFFVVLALVCFFFAVENRTSSPSEAPIRWPWFSWTLIAWLAMGLGVLTKGPVAFAVPLLVATPYAIWRRTALSVWHPLGPVLMFAVALPWVWAVSREIPNFLHYVVVTETWARMTTDELRRTEPVWFFLPVLLVGTFPWSILALSNLRSKNTPSLSRGKQEQYMLPLVSVVALLVASRWKGRPRGVRFAGAIWGILGLAMLTVAALGVPGLDTDRVPTDVAVRTAIGFGIAALVGAVIAWFGASRRRQLAVIGLALPLMAFPVVSAGLLEAVAADRSARGLALEIENHLAPDTELLWIESYASGVSFYLERPIPVATTDGDELRSNYILRNAEVFLDDEGLLRPLAAAERSVSDCDGQHIFLLSTKSRDLGDAIEASGVLPLMENRRWLAFGPDCVPAEIPVVEGLDDGEVGE